MIKILAVLGGVIAYVVGGHLFFKPHWSAYEKAIISDSGVLENVRVDNSSRYIESGFPLSQAFSLVIREYSSVRDLARVIVSWGEVASRGGYIFFGLRKGVGQWEWVKARYRQMPHLVGGGLSKVLNLDFDIRGFGEVRDCCNFNIDVGSHLAFGRRQGDFIGINGGARATASISRGPRREYHNRQQADYFNTREPDLTLGPFRLSISGLSHAPLLTKVAITAVLGIFAGAFGLVVVGRKITVVDRRPYVIAGYCISYILLWLSITCVAILIA